MYVNKKGLTKYWSHPQNYTRKCIFFAIVFIDLLRNGDMRADRNCGSLLVGLHFQLVFIFLGDFEPVAEIKEHSRSKGYTEQI